LARSGLAASDSPSTSPSPRRTITRYPVCRKRSPAIGAIEGGGPVGPWILAAVGACTNGGPPLGPPGEPGESRLLGTEQWRVPDGAVGLAWRGEDLLVAAKEVLVTVGADGLPQRDRLPTRATTLAVRGEEVVIGTSDGDLMRVGDRLRLDGDPGWIVAVDIGPDGAAIAALSDRGSERGSAACPPAGHLRPLP
jgi:hypothetical protein